MRLLTLVLLAAITTFSAHAAGYKEMAWKEFGTFSLHQGKDTVVEMKGAEGMFLRVFVPDACGHTSFGMSATGLPIDPAIVYAENYYTPEGRTLYYFVREEKQIAFKKIWLQHAKITSSAVCPVTLSLAPAPVACGEGPKVLAQGHATSNVAEYIARNLAWDRTVANARRQCGGTPICKLPGKSSCSGTGHGHYFQFECHGWFVCTEI